jgi:2-C-methyl-D-erythritol 4-phosphate cytidylyltransferase
MSVTVIIPSAGSGQRMKSHTKKQFLLLDHIPMIVRTLKVFNGFGMIDEIIIATAQEDISHLKTLIDAYEFDFKIVFAAGGKERQTSVYNALNLVKSPYVLIHDGARPFVSRNIIREHLEQISMKPALITGIAVVDTIKEFHMNKVVKTMDRSKLLQVQTPQTFHTKVLKDAFEKALKDKIIVTDDASLVENLGIEVEIIQGSPFNIKITKKEDLTLGEFILRSLS